MNKGKVIFHLILLTSIVLLFFYIGNSSKITEEDLIGGTWVATAGYKEGKLDGEANCTDYLMEGLKFKQDGVAYVGKLDEEFEYSVKYSEEGTKIIFITKNSYYSYYIDKISKDEIGLVGGLESLNNHPCYFKRNK